MFVDVLWIISVISDVGSVTVFDWITDVGVFMVTPFLEVISVSVVKLVVCITLAVGRIRLLG